MARTVREPNSDANRRAWRPRNSSRILLAVPSTDRPNRSQRPELHHEGLNCDTVGFILSGRKPHTSAGLTSPSQVRGLILHTDLYRTFASYRAATIRARS